MGRPPKTPTVDAGVLRPRLRDFSQSLPMSLLRAREAVMSGFRPGLRALDLTEQQWRVLRALAAVDSISVLDLATTTFLLPPSMSRILRDLVARDLVRREPAAYDQRRGVVSISAAGTKMIERAGRWSEDIYAEIARRYGGERLVQLQAMLRELEAVMLEPIASQGRTGPAQTVNGTAGTSPVAGGETAAGRTTRRRRPNER